MNTIDYLEAKGFVPTEDNFSYSYKLQLALGVSLQIKSFNKKKVVDILLFDYTQIPCIEDKLFISSFNETDEAKKIKLNEFIGRYKIQNNNR